MDMVGNIVKKMVGEKGKDPINNVDDKVGSIDLNVVKKIYGEEKDDD